MSQYTASTVRKSKREKDAEAAEAKRKEEEAQAAKARKKNISMDVYV